MHAKVFAKLQQFLHIFLRTINRVETICIVSILAIIVLVMSTEVTMRYIFQNPLTWAQEVAILLLIYLSYFAADIVYRSKGHVGISYFIDLFPHTLKNIIQLIIYICISIFLVVVSIKSIVLVKIQSTHLIAAVLPLPKSFWILPVTITFPSMLLSTVYFILNEINGKPVNE